MKGKCGGFLVMYRERSVFKDVGYSFGEREVGWLGVIFVFIGNLFYYRDIFY